MSIIVLLIDINIRMGQEEGDNFVMAIATSPNECSSVVVTQDYLS